MSQKTAIYARTAPGTEPIDTQREKALAYTTDVLGINPADSRVLSDSGTYTRVDDTSGHQRLFDLATAGAIERVIMCDAARIATNIRDLNDRITRLVEAGVTVHIIESGLRIGESGDDTMPDDQTMLCALILTAIST